MLQSLSDGSCLMKKQDNGPAGVNWHRIGDIIAGIGFSFTQILILLLFALSLRYQILDWMGELEGRADIQTRIPLMTLLLVSIVAIYLLQERKQEHKELRQAISEREAGFKEELVTQVRSVAAAHSTEFRAMLDAKGLELVGAMKGVSVDQKKDQTEYYDCLASAIREAKTVVEDLTWGEVSPTTRNNAEEQAYQRYLEALREASRSTGGVRVREIYTFPNVARVSRAEDFLINQQLNNYWARYYDLNHAFIPPLMQFTVIDRKLVILGTHRGKLGHTERENYVVIQHPYIAEKFASYFHAIWISAAPLRDPSKHNLSALGKMREKLRKKGGGK